MVRHAAWYLALLFPIAASAQTITGAEYFFDTDPGPGNATAVIVPTGAASSSTLVLNASAIAVGFHTLNLRYRNDLGQWGIAKGGLFLVMEVQPTGSLAPASPLSAAEYFFDSDPGAGLASPLTIPPGNTSSTTTAIDASALAPGFHTLGIRYRAANGTWGITAGRTFYVNQGALGGPGAAPDITAAEYFIDIDPGTGLGTAVAISSGPNTSTAFTVDASALAPGFHTLNLRHRDSQGHWSIAKSHLFSVYSTSPGAGHPPSANIVAAEYFIDTDPGVGLATSASITAGATTTGNILMDVSAAGIGTHVLGVRLKDANGNWSIADAQTFTVGTPAAPANNDCANATSVALQPPATCPTGAVAGTTIGATGNGGIPCHTGTPADVWYTVNSATAEGMGVTLAPTTAGGMGLRVLDGCNGNTIYCGAGEAHSFVVAPSTSYLLQVFSLAQGTFSICVFEDLVQEDCLGVLGGSALPGTPCDDSNAATIDDVYQTDCQCAGYDCADVLGGTTGPGAPCLAGTGPTGVAYNGSYNGTCDCAWIDCNSVPNGPDFPGQACDDANAASPSSIRDAGCACVPYDCQGTPNGPYMIGSTCAAGAYPAGAIDPVINAACTCTWTDCLGVVNGNTLPGTPCNDGNSATVNDVFGNNCQCAGVILDCLGVVNGPAMPGTPCTVGAETGTWSAGCTCVIPRPDVVVSNVTSAPTTIVPGDSVDVHWNVANVGTASMPNNWIERVRVRSSSGQNLTLLAQRTYNVGGSLASGSDISRTLRVLVPVQFNVGDQCVFVVEVVPGSGITEVSGGTANNTSVQTTAWDVAKKLYLSPATFQMTEGGSTFALDLRRTGSTNNPLVVNIANTNAARIGVPTSITMTAGQHQYFIAVQPLNNSLVDGTAQGTISMSATDFTGASTTATVLDDEQPELSFVGFPTSTMEGNNYTFQVATNLAPTSPLTVTLTTSNATRFPLPASVVIQPGNTSASVTVNLAQDILPELNITVTAQAGAAGHIPANAATLVADDDVPGLELVLATNTVSESGGLSATQATLRRVAGSSPVAFTAGISASLGNTLILPTSLSLAAGQQQITFNIGVVDNALNDGTRNVTITAALTIPSCGCGAPPTSAGYVTNSLSVLDNDGPTLTVTPIPLTLAEGLAPAGQLRVQRNTSTATALSVSLSSSEITEATVPASTTIPIGGSYVDVPITTINDGVSDGSKVVYFNASAAGFSPGVAWAMVTDVNKPDLRIVAQSSTASVVPVLGGLGYEVSITNSGFATAPTGVLLRGYLSTNSTVDADDVVMIEQVVNTAIPAGDTITLQGVAIVPDLPGDRHLLFMVNPLASITELLHTNNTGTPIALNIRPAYTATANVAQAHYFRDQPIPITGSAMRLDGSPATNVSVETYVINTLGMRREVMATTDGAGNFSASFVPLTNEVGHFSVGADFPDMNTTTEQDAFDILGVRVNNGSLPQFFFTLGDTLEGNMAIRNLCSVPLSSVTIASVNLPSGAVITFGTLPVLGANASAAIPYQVSGTAVTPGNNYVQAELKVTCSLGDIQPCYIQYYCQTPQGHITTDPASITATASASLGQRVVEVTVVNTGAGPTGAISVSLPQVAWLNSITPLNLPSVSPGDTAIVILRFLANASIPFNYPVTGTIGINTANGNDVGIPFSFTKVSESSGEVVVVVENQFTYFAAGQPMVEGALVKIKNYYTGAVYAQGLTDVDGRFVANGVPEGTHRVTVEKEQHITHSGEISVNPGASVQHNVFLVYQAVTFSWTVVPTEIEDSYTVTLSTNFQTNVPIPVVTVEGPDSVPHVEPGTPYAFDLVLENHGLVTAENVQVILPTSHATYEFITTYQAAPLAALSSVTVPVLMRVREDGMAADESGSSVEEISAFLGMSEASYDAYRDADQSCREVWLTQYEYACNEENGFIERTGNSFMYSTQDCSTGPDYGDDGLVGWSLGSIQQGGAWDCAICGDDITGASNQGTGPGGAITNIADCRQCKEGVVSAVGGALVSCVPGPLIGKYFGDAAGCIGGNIINQTSDPMDWAGCTPIPMPPGPPTCVAEVGGALLDCFLGSAGGPSPGFMVQETVEQATQRDGGGDSVLYYMHLDLMMVARAFNAQRAWADHYYREMGHSDAWDDLYPMLEPHVVSLEPFTVPDQATIINAMTGYELDPADLQGFFDRWNMTREAWDLGVYAPTAQYPDIIVRDSIIGWSDTILVVMEYAGSRGYSSIAEMYTTVMEAVQAIIDDPATDAVCASVTVQFSQQVTMTREAFTGTLAIHNGHPEEAMDSLSVNILITDLDDVPSNGLFQINTQSLINLSDVTGTGQLAAEDDGTVVFQFIPTNAAAPTVPKQYRFGGSMTYWDPYAQAMTTLPFTPITLTVNPGPDLMLHYFLERDILGDDALTEDVVEPSVPAELAVMVRNDGYGAANNLIISSAQPEIVDNENGLLVDFQIIGSNLQGQPANLGVTNIHFGTVPPLGTRIGQWYMTSSLLGHFSDYDAQVVHNNSFGNPELSLIQGAEFHELTHSIKAYGTLDDGITDFLVNDIFDAFDVPDIIYFSQGDSTAPVMRADAGSFSSLVSAPSFTNTLTIDPDEGGWNFIKLDDPGQGKYNIASVTRQDGQVVPLNNAWLTFVTLPVQQLPVYENKFHFVDRTPGSSPMTYTVVWTPRDTATLRVDTISDVPLVTSAEQLQQLTVAFNKPVDFTSLNYHDISLHFDGGPDLITAPLPITPLDDRTVTVDLSALTSANGTFAFVVDATGVEDIYDLTGVEQDTVTWTQYHSVPAVQAFLGIPVPALATAYSAIAIRFNLPIDISSVSADDFLLLFNGDTVSNAITIDSVSSDLRTFHLSGLAAMMLDDGMYTFVVDVPNVRTTSMAQGLAQQSIQLALDNSGPTVTSITTSNTGGLDAQHITSITIHLSESVPTLPLAALSLVRGATPIPLGGMQLIMLTPTQWRLSGLGFSTYNEGAYLFTVNAALLADALGNIGTGTTPHNWSVVRTTTLTVTDPGITPDMGYSTTDEVTATLTMNVVFSLNEAAQNVRVARVVGNTETTLAQVNNLDPGSNAVPITLPSGGTTTVRVIATALNGISTSIQFNVFADVEPLTAVWNTLQGQVRTTPLDQAHLNLSTRLLDEDAVIGAVHLTRDGTPLATGMLDFTITGNTNLSIANLAAQTTSPGTYRLSVDLTMLTKYSSGAVGSESTELYWVVVPEDQTVKLALKVLLDGPYDITSGRMHDSLRVAGVVPTEDPYPALGYAYVNNGTYAVLPSWLAIQGDNAIVDWVVVELRDRVDPSIILHNQPALLQRDGDVVGTDGTWPLPLPTAAGAYYIAVRHRNHLGAMTAATVSLGDSPTVVDLTQPTTLAYGTEARRPINNIRLLWSGDVNSDGWVKYTGSQNDRDPILQAIGGTVPTTVIQDTYVREDVNMDGNVMYTGQGNDRDPILSNIGGVTPTNVRSAQLP